MNRRNKQNNAVRFPVKTAKESIKKIEKAISLNNKETSENVVAETVQVFSNYIENIAYGLELYNYAEEGGTYINDLKILRVKLEAEIEMAGGTLDGMDTDTAKPVKVFISHSSNDLPYIEALVSLLEHIGLKKQHMFCSSVPPYDVPLDEDIYEHLKKLMQTNDLYVAFVLSNNFYKSAASLNEMGAAWVLQHDYMSILLPGFEFREIKGAVNPNKSAIKLDAGEKVLKAKLGQLKDKLIRLLGLEAIDSVLWESYRDEFIDKVKEISASCPNTHDEAAEDEQISEIALGDNFYGKEINLNYTEMVLVLTSNTTIHRKTVKVTLDVLFKFVSLSLTGVKTIKEFRSALSKYQPGYHVAEQDALIVRNKYEQLGLIESFIGKDNAEMVRLTDLGRKVMNKLNQ